MTHLATAALAFFVAAGTLASARRAVGRGFLTISSDMQPQVVAQTLVRVEDDWRAQAAAFAECNTTGAECDEAPQQFEKSCATVVSAVVQASSGDRAVVQEYLSDICGEPQLKEPWRLQLCQDFSSFVEGAMTGDAYKNREDLDSAKLCRSFWGGFADGERTRVERERAERAAQLEAEAKRRAEAEQQAAAARAEAEQRSAEEAAAAARRSAEEKRAAQAAEASRQADTAAARAAAEADRQATEVEQSVAEAEREVAEAEPAQNTSAVAATKDAAEETAAKPEDAAEKPEDAVAKPEDAAAEPEDAAAKPEDAAAKADDAAAKPDEAAAKPNATASAVAAH